MILGIPTGNCNIVLITKNLSEGCQVFKHHRKNSATRNRAKTPVFTWCEKIQNFLCKGQGVICFESCISSEKKIKLQCPCQGLRQIFRKNLYVLTYVLEQFMLEFNIRGFEEVSQNKMTYFILIKMFIKLGYIIYSRIAMRAT